MALDKLVDSSQLDADLTSVANAIRKKGGTSGQLAFPDGFVSAVQAIETGGAAPTLVTKNITENGTYNASSDNADGYSSVTVNVQGGSGDYTIDDWTDQNKPVGAITVTATYTSDTDFQCMLNQRRKITSVSFPNTTKIPNRFCYNCTSLKEISMPNVKTICVDAFRFCPINDPLVLPEVTEIRGTAFYQRSSGTSTIKTIDLCASTGGTIGASGLAGLPSLDTLILRSSTIWTLANVNSFLYSRFQSGRSGGTLYVPQDLIGQYTQAANWSTILGYGSGAQNQILPIEGSIYETQYADGTPIPTT